MFHVVSWPRLYRMVTIVVALGVFGGIMLSAHTVWRVDEAERYAAMPVMAPVAANSLPVAAEPIPVPPVVTENVVTDSVAVENGGLSTGETFISGSTDSWEQFRLLRTQSTSKQIEYYYGAVERLPDDDPLRGELTAALFALVERAEAERELEAWIVNRGVRDALVYARSDGVEVMLSDRLNFDEVQRIGRLVAQTFGTPLETVVVVDGALP